MHGGDGPNDWRSGLSPLSGVSVDGVPLSENRAPAPDLDPWVARLVSAKVHNRPDAFVACGMCNDLVYVRRVFRGRWTAKTADGLNHYANEPLLFGQHSVHMPLTCTGDVISAGIGLRPGAFHALTGRGAYEIADRILQEDPFGLTHPDFDDAFDLEKSPEEWNDALEEAMRRYIAKVQPDPSDPISTQFEMLAFQNPELPLSEFADRLDISLRKLERVVKRDFGLTPKRVLRRARALDLASQLCGVADDEEAEAMILRYFDQSHLIREFTEFFGATPHQFRRARRPLLTLNLEQRQARRLELLQRLGPKDKRPWRAD